MTLKTVKTIKKNITEINGKWRYEKKGNGYERKNSKIKMENKINISIWVMMSKY